MTMTRKNAKARKDDDDEGDGMKARLAELNRKIERLLKEVEELRREIRRK